VKYLLILALFAFVALAVFWRLRPYIQMARRALGVVRDVRRISRQDMPGPAPRRAGTSGERLVRCSSCGTWLPSSRAIAVRSSAEVYCSTNCLERPASSGSSQTAGGEL
jgi:hypothetical protein